MSLRASKRPINVNDDTFSIPSIPSVASTTPSLTAPSHSSSALTKVLNMYCQLILEISSIFLKSLFRTRATNIRYKVSEGSCDNIRREIVQAPVLTTDMLLYVMTQMLPLEPILKQSSISSTYTSAYRNEEKQQVIKMFNGLMKDVLKYLNENHCWPTDRKNMINDYAVNLFLKSKDQIKAYLEEQTEATTIQEYQQALKDLSLFNDLQLTNINFITSNFQKVTKFNVWILSAIADWLGIDIVENNDIEFLIDLSLLKTQNISYYDLKHLFSAQPDTILYKPLQSALLNNNLYINESALTKLAGWYQLLSETPAYMSSTLEIAEYMYNLY
jgi:hypothetical protein